MSEYANANAVDELAGSDKNYKASAEGQLTGFVAKHPRCVILLDEIEKASLDVIHLFLQVLDAGRLRDNHTDQEVSFADAILIFTTNAGRELYENSEVRNLSTLSRDTILDALGRDLNPKTKEPLFPAAMCSRFASGNVVMFNHLEAHILRRLIEKRLAHHAGNLSASTGVSLELDEAVSTALLLAEGASADARMVKAAQQAKRPNASIYAVERKGETSFLFFTFFTCCKDLSSGSEDPCRHLAESDCSFLHRKRYTCE
jgi:ATP-dependent Clp protease ATP-binding subunit ClpA